MQYILTEFELQMLQDKANSYEDLERFIKLLRPENIPNYSASDVAQILRVLKSHLL